MNDRWFGLSLRLLVLATLVGPTVLLASPALAGDATVMLADGRTLEKVDLKPGPTDNEVVLALPDGTSQPVKSQDLLAVDLGRVLGRPLAPTVRMANGNQVNGKVTFPSARQVKIAAGWGSITVPLKWCTAIRVNEKAALPDAVTKDTVILAGDRVEGEIQGIANGKVNIDLSGQQVALDLARVQALALAPRPPDENSRTGLLLGIDLGGGERISGRWVRLTEDVLTITPDWGGTLDIPIGSVSRLEVKNGRLVYLSDLKPSESRQVPYLDETFPHRNDLSVSGRPLKLAGKRYARGLGVHSKSELTYTLDGGYQTFQSLLGIDDAVGAQGSVIYRIYGDEKLLFESPIVRGGDSGVEVKVPLKGVLLLRLVVDYADNGDVADHANWADARLLRP